MPAIDPRFVVVFAEKPSAEDVAKAQAERARTIAAIKASVESAKAGGAWTDARPRSLRT